MRFGLKKTQQSRGKEMTIFLSGQVKNDWGERIDDRKERKGRRKKRKGKKGEGNKGEREARQFSDRQKQNNNKTAAN